MVNYDRFRKVPGLNDKLQILFTNAITDVLITYSTDSLLSLRGGSIEVQKSLSEKRSGPSVLRITDPYQRVFFFPLEQCKTWFVRGPHPS